MKGAKRDLEESDIYQPVKADESEKLTDHLEKWVLLTLEISKRILTYGRIIITLVTVTELTFAISKIVNES